MSHTRDQAFAAIVSQIIASGASLALQAIALWTLGQEGLGVYSILVAGVLVTINSVHTGFIGDALTVVDRFDPGLRRALIIASRISMVLAFGVGAGCAIALGRQPIQTALLFGAAVLMWTVEETGRRLMMARMEFWKLVVNDSSYVFGAASVLTVVWVTRMEFTLNWLIAANLAGSTVSAVLGWKQLPRFELLWRGGRGLGDLRRLISFSGWRAAQIGVRPLSMLLVRVVVARVKSNAVLGLLETGRLLVAPAITVANGAGGYLLAFFARSKSNEEVSAIPREVRRLATVVFSLVVLYGLVLVGALPWINLLLGDKRVSASMVLGWSVFAAAYAANIAIANFVTSRGYSKQLFMGRAVDAFVTLGLVAVTAGWLDLGFVPIAMAIGVVVGTGFAILRTGMGPQPVDQWGSQAFISVDPHRPSLAFARSWYIIAPLWLMVATDYKFRKRPLSSSLSGEIDSAIIFELVTFAVVAAFLFLFLATPLRARRPTAVQFFTRAFCVYLAVSALWSPYPKLASVRATQLLVMLALSVIMSSRVTRSQMMQLAHAYVVMILISIAIGLVWHVPFSRLQVGRFNWMHVHSNSVGSMLAIALVVVVGIGLGAPRRFRAWPRGAYYVMAGVIAVALVATKTRGSMAGGIAGVIVVVALSIRRTNRVPAVGIAVVASTFGAIVLQGYLVEIATRGENATQLASLSNRTALWALAYQRVLDRPLLGWGMTASRGIFFEDVNLGGAHNALVNAFVDGGLIGGLLWMAMLGAVAGGLITARRRGMVDAVVPIGVFATLLVNAVTTEGIGSGAGVSFIWLLLICSWVGVLQRRTVGNPPQNRTKNSQQVAVHLTR